jgi:hypothetical protein
MKGKVKEIVKTKEDKYRFVFEKAEDLVVNARTFYEFFCLIPMSDAKLVILNMKREK